MNCETWGGPDYQRNYLKWWFSHLPRAEGVNFANGRLNDWWEYVYGFHKYDARGHPRLPVDATRERERIAALIALGGRAVVLTRDGRVDVRSMDTLPAGECELIEVDLTGRKLAGADDLRPLAGASRLRRLNLGGSGVTDAALIALEELPALEWISLSNTGATDAAMAAISRWPELTYFEANRTQLGDATLLALSMLPAIREMHLSHTRVTDAGLSHLATARPLKTLSIEGTAITRAAADQLRAALGDVSIRR